MCEQQLRELGFKSLERGGPRQFQRAKRELVFIGLFYLVKVFVFATNGMFLPIFFLVFVLKRFKGSRDILSP